MPFIGRVGFDPEVSIISTKTGLGRSAHTFVKELKQFTFYRDGDKGKLSGQLGSEYERDGAAIEVRSVVPSACRDNVIPYLAEALRQANLDMRKALGNDFVLSCAPKYVLDEVSLKNPPKDVVEFGCRPDIDAYALNAKDPVCEPEDRRRWTGGHIHASRVQAARNVEQQAAWAILFDYTVVAPFVAILGEKFAEGEAERRTMYGQPGSFRYDDELDKIEFRTLSGRMLLSPTLVYWVMGAMKSMFSQTSDPMALVRNLTKKIPSEQVFSAIEEHNVSLAEEITSKVFQLLPNYAPNSSDLANPMTGGGAGTRNPYFFEQAAKVFIEANHAGLTYRDDVEFNWGLYDSYEPKHHAYWGIQQAMVGLLDEDIFPQRQILGKVWPKQHVQSVAMWTHPQNGGEQKYVTPGAIGWLR